jgi:hypothetical protein
LGKERRQQETETLAANASILPLTGALKVLGNVFARDEGRMRSVSDVLNRMAPCTLTTTA